MTRKHELWTTEDGRIVYRITDFHTGERISLRDRSASEYILTLEDLAREVTADLESFIIPRRLDGYWTVNDALPRVTAEFRGDFEFPRALIVPEDLGADDETLERSM